MSSKYFFLELILFITIFSIQYCSAGDSSCSEEPPCRYRDVRTLIYHGIGKLRKFRDALLNIWKNNPDGQKDAITALVNAGMISKFIDYFLFGDYDTVLKLAKEHAHDSDVISDCHSMHSSPETSDSKTELGDSNFDSTGSIFSCSQKSRSESSHSSEISESESETSKSMDSISESSDWKTSKSSESMTSESSSESSDSKSECTSRKKNIFVLNYPHPPYKRSKSHKKATYKLKIKM